MGKRMSLILGILCLFLVSARASGWRQKSQGEICLVL